VLVQAARERQSKAWFRRPEDRRNEDRLVALIRLGPVVWRDTTIGLDRASPEGDSQLWLLTGYARVVTGRRMAALPQHLFRGRP
jgi:hypothetical protein